MENITKFLGACKDLGVPATSRFATVDLFEGKDLNGVVGCLYGLSAAAASRGDFPGPFLVGREEGALSEAAMSNLKVIVAVSESRERHRAALGDAEDDAERAALEREHEDMVAEAVEYRLAMLGLADAALSGAEFAGVDRAALEAEYLVVYSSSTKTSRASEADERRLVHLLSVKKKKYEMVYVDVSPERREELDAVAPDAPLPALIAGGVYHGAFEALQELEDDGELDAIVAPAPDGAGFWALPEEWGVQSSMLEGGGITLLNDVPVL
mmetsp:Transcript_19342/g.60547  ORF Transcript_19342/g.60547 Transcript_19342/m.60547 type:complete len:269 (+) Transcript_19342:1554-2360(+)